MAKVQIIVDAVDQATKELKGINQQLDKMDDNVKQLDRSITNRNPIESMTASWADFTSALGLAERVMQGAQQVWAATAQEYINYGNEVEKVTRLTGLQAEEASRLIQVADDVFISQESLNNSLRVAAKNYDISIDGLAKMADQYKSLDTAQQKAEFASKRFGRNYVEIVKLLEQGGQAIKEMAASQPEGLILDDNDLQRIREYKKSVDELNDAFSALKMQIGEQLVPWTTRLIVAATHQKEIQEEQNRLMKEGASWNDANKQAILNVIKALYGQADAGQAAADGMDALDEAQQQADESAKKLSQALQTTLNNMFAINSQNKQYQDTIADLTKSDAELAAKKNQLTLQMWEEQRAGKLTNDEYLRYVQQIDDVNKSIDENAQKRQQASDDLAKAGEKQIYDLVQQRLAADGIIDSGEFEYLQKLAVQKGLVTQADADQAIQASRTADTLVASFQKTQPAMDKALETMLQIKSMDGTIVNFGVAFTQSGSLAGQGGTVNPSGYTPITFSSTGSPMNIPSVVRDQGGAGMAGEPYLIGTGAQPEAFIPSTNGTFIPNADKAIGNTYNIVVNNPKRETAENSIRSALKNLSFLGVTGK